MIRARERADCFAVTKVPCKSGVWRGFWQEKAEFGPWTSGLGFLVEELSQVPPFHEDHVVVFERLLEFGTRYDIKVALAPR